MRILALLLLVACSAQPASFDQASDAEARADFKLAAKLFAEVGTPEAELRLANIEWRVFENLEAAEARLKKLDDHKANLELARIAMKRRDFAAARRYADIAAEKATMAKDKRRAIVARAAVAVEDPKPDEIRATIAALRDVIAVDGPLLKPARLLAHAGLLAGDGAAAMEGIDGYYHVSAFSAPPNLIAPSHAVLKRVLPSWRGGENAELAEALAGIRFFEEAAMVAPRTSDIVAYAAARKRVETLVDRYYRDLALGRARTRDLKDGVKREIGDRFRRFQPYVNIGETGDRVDLHMGHPVLERKLGTVRFLVLDGMVSNGFTEWAADGRSGDGGWATKTEIYQVRPMYANGPLRDWMRLTDPDARAEDDRKIAEETARDAVSAKEQPVRRFWGLVHRLERQYLEKVQAETHGRDEFLARLEHDEFQTSIELHEGKHAEDAASGVRYATWELEYRGKLAEIMLGDAPRPALANILGGPIADDSPHGKAATKLAEGLIGWMRAHASEVKGLDVNAPLLPQADKLTDAQLKAAVASLPPR